MKLNTTIQVKKRKFALPSSKSRRRSRLLLRSGFLSFLLSGLALFAGVGVGFSGTFFSSSLSESESSDEDDSLLVGSSESAVPSSSSSSSTLRLTFLRFTTFLISLSDFPDVVDSSSVDSLSSSSDELLSESLSLSDSSSSSEPGEQTNYNNTL